jgi:SPP1 gp7 family putative phage head morphogenesis protein
MNEQQAFKAIRNAIRLENLGRDIAAKITPEILRIMKEVQAEVLKFPGPTEAIARQIQYKQFELRLASLFQPMSRQFYQELTSALSAEVETQVRWAQEFINAAEKAPASQAVAMAGQEGVGVLPATGAGPVGQTFVPQVTRTQLLALTDETEVLGKRLIDLFQWQDVAGSPYIQSTIKKVDQVVKRGFLLSETNEEIARNLAPAIKGQMRDARAIARTAVMDMSQRAHERMWDANSDRIKMWEFDATFDYRVCPQCYPYDGKRAKDRSNLPTVPVHPNCRCRVLPLTATELALEKEEMAEGMQTSIVEVNKDPRNARGRVYKTKARVDGNKMTKSAREINIPKGQRPTMADFISETTPDTREAVLGKVRAREFEYITSDNRGPKRQDIQEALRFVTNGDAAAFEKAQRARRRRRK